MIELSKNNIQVSREIANTTSVLIFDNEEIILTHINKKHFGHIITKNNDQERGWSINYLINNDKYNILTRNIIIEKEEKKCYFGCHYTFYEPIEIIGKGNELPQYENLFKKLENLGSIYTSETTLLLRRKSNK